MKKDKKTMERIVALCKNRGFVFPGSDIYGGLANTWDYGPLGVEFKNNVKQAWWKKFIKECPYNVGLDAAILMNPETWIASGHVGGFSDPLMDCKDCKARFRADHIIENYAQKKGLDVDPAVMEDKDMEDFIAEKEINCPTCGNRNFTGIRKFNLMFKTFQGVTEDSSSEIFLRPETAQGIFVNFKNVQRSTRKRIPFGIGQIGKSFRNEITPGNFTFRTREFEQMELEFFCAPAEEMQWFNYWKDFCHNWLLSLGMTPESIKLRDHSEDELSHYSNATTDIEFMFPFGWGELWGIADRTDFDLKQHQEQSVSMEYVDPVTNEKYLPYCIEPSLGADRVALAFLCDAYDEEELENGQVRTVMRLSPALAPFKAAVLPQQKKLGDKAQEVYDMLLKDHMVDYDVTGSIGKRYRRQDEIGTPYCITVDFDTLDDNQVTIRNRDTMEQVRISIDKVSAYISEKGDVLDMEYKRFGNKIVARFDRGEEILQALTELCEKENVRLASVSALGAVSSATIGNYNTVEKKYYAKDFAGIFEITSLSGTVSRMDGEVYLHLHCVLADDTYGTVGGHLSRAVVSATCEMVIDVIDGEVDRKLSDEIGLNLFKF